MEQFGIFEVNPHVLGDVQERATPHPLVVKIKTGQGSISSVSSAPSPAIKYKGKDMETMLQLAKEEREEARRAKAAKERKPAKVEKRKAATPSSSSSSICSFKTNSSEELEPAEKMKARKKRLKANEKSPSESTF